MDPNFGHMSLGEAFVSGLVIGGAVVALAAGAMFNILHRLKHPDERVLQTWDRGDHVIALMQIERTP